MAFRAALRQPWLSIRPRPTGPVPSLSHPSRVPLRYASPGAAHRLQSRPRVWAPSPPLLSSNGLQTRARWFASASSVRRTPSFEDSDMKQALMNNSREEVGVLLRGGMDPDLFVDGAPILCHAAGKCASAIVQLLIDHRADPNMHSPHGSALLAAVREGRPENVSVLLRARADLSVQDSFGVSPISAAVRNGQLETTKLLLDAGAPINDADDELLGFALDRQDLQMVRLLLQYKANPNRRMSLGGRLKHQPTLLMATARSHLPQFMKALLEAKADPNVADSAGVTPAWLVKDPVKLHMLAEYGADFNVRNKVGTSLLFTAANHSSPEIVRTLLRLGADPNIVDRQRAGPVNALVAAVSRQDPEMVRTLLEGGCNLTGFSERFSVTHVAAIVSSAEVMDVLLEFNADLNVVDSNGRSALQMIADRHLRHPEQGFDKVLAKHGIQLPDLPDCPVAADGDLKPEELKPVSPPPHDIEGGLGGNTASKRQSPQQP